MSSEPIPNIARVAGPPLIGYILNWALYGALSIQIYLYYEGYPNDSRLLKSLVYGIYVLETAQSILFMDSAFKTYAIGFGDLTSLDRIGTIWISVPLIGGIVAFSVQSFYAYRIHILSRSVFLVGIIMFFALVQLGAAFSLVVSIKQAVLFSRLLSRRTLIENTIWEGSTAICDITIAVCMTYALKKRDSGTMKKTHDIVTRIIRLTIETGSMTAAVAIVALVLTFVSGTATYYQASVLVLGKVYSNTLMVLLNIRTRAYAVTDVLEVETGQFQTTAQFQTRGMISQMNPTVQCATRPPLLPFHRSQANTPPPDSETTIDIPRFNSKEFGSSERSIQESSA